MKRSKTDDPIKVFLSYSQGDKDFARKIRNLLSQRLNVKMFTDEDLSAGGDWTSRLRQEIEDANVVVALLTPQSITSNWVLQEVGAAWGIGKPIISIVTEKSVHTRWPIQLNSEMALELKDLDTPESAERFVSA